ncbi:hypothetical protein AAY473_002008 [Plecturocebus cupreus]
MACQVGVAVDATCRWLLIELSLIHLGNCCDEKHGSDSSIISTTCCVTLGTILNLSEPASEGYYEDYVRFTHGHPWTNQHTLPPL